MPTQPMTKRSRGGILSPLKRLYDWTLSLAEHKYAQAALFFLSLAESSFFPVPPDLLGIALCTGKPKKSFVFATVCTVGSVVGGILGYWIGMTLWDSLGPIFFAYVPKFTPEVFESVQQRYEENAIWVVFIAAFTPIPYKVITVTAGVAGIPFLPFVAVSTVGRGLRYFLWAGAIYFFGAGIKNYIDKYFEIAVALFAVMGIGGFWAVKYLL